MDEQKMRAWRAFLGAHAGLIRVLERELKAARKLPLTWFDALVQIDEAGGQMRMNELADHLLISRSATTRFVDRLEREDLVQRDTCSGDRRGMNLSLTDHGRDVLARARSVHREGVQRHFGSLISDEEARLLADVLGRVAAANSTDAGGDRSGD